MTYADENKALTAVIAKFPKAWHGLFDVLHTSEKQLMKGRQWFEHVSSSQYGDRSLCLSGLVKTLCKEEPIIFETNLKYVPLILQFPSHLQRNIVGFLDIYKDAINKQYLKLFLGCLNKFSDLIKDSWTKCYEKSISKYLHDKFSNYECSEGMVEKFNSIVDRTKHFPNKNPSNSWNFFVLDEQPPASHPIQTSQSTEGFDISASFVPASLLTPFDVNTPTKSQCKDVSSGTTQPKENPKKRPSDNFSPPEDCLTHNPSKRIRTDIGENPIEQDTTINLSQCSDRILSSQASSFIKIMEMNSFSTHQQHSLTKLKEFWQSCNETTMPTPEEVHLLKDFTTDQMSDFCHFLEVEKFSEMAMANMCIHVTALCSELSYSNSTAFTKSCILPHVQRLEQNPPRTSHNALVTFSKSYPKQLIEGLILPCLNNGHFGTVQADLFSKLVKEALLIENQQELLRQICFPETQWNEHTASLIQPLLDKKILLDCSLLSSLIRKSEKKSITLADNLKFGKFLLAVVNKYGKQLNQEDILCIDRVLETHRTFLKKTVSSALKRVKR